ncbi:MAG TPA: flagellar biosynthesis anti-sigma factor FlgM [Methylophilaceae bacterium]|nr:flagellar biosynthesis anti-sigma factor FlgM [Methylophilaceae bacterium]
MKINDAIQNNLGVSAEKPDSRASTKADKTSVEAAKSGSVTLSALSSQLQSLEASVAADNVYDTEKVDAIKLAISNGQFKVDAEKVADGLISTVKDLLKTK